MSERVQHLAKTGPGLVFLVMILVPFGLMIYTVFLQPSSGPSSSWSMVASVIVGMVGFVGWAIRSETGGKERRQALAGGMSSVVARLLALDGPKGYAGESPQMALELELPDGGVVSDLVIVPLGLMGQLIPGTQIPILLSQDGYFNLDTEAMSRVSPS